MSSKSDYAIYRQGKLCGDKIRFRDGVGCCIWYPFITEDDPEDLSSGICFDFSANDLDDMIALLTKLKEVEPDEYIEDEEEKEDGGSSDDGVDS